VGDQAIDWTNDSEVYEHIEKQYWNLVENQVGDLTRVEYAADLNASIYGSGFGNYNHPWNFKNFQKQTDSLLQFQSIKEISGVNVAWMYVGMKFSTFCWHFEDLMLPSINYSHFGKPKLWYGVPENNREKFDKAVREKCSLLFKKDPNILFDVITMISPTYLRSQGVKVYKTLQRPGEFVVTYPGSYHGGFSTGLNIGEAVNFTTMSWLKYGLKCQGIYRASQERIPVFPIEWVLTENIRSLGKVKLSKAGLETIRNHFSAMLSDEIRSRKQMEAFLKDYYGSED
jgi:histone demethylase JARID1